MGRGISAPLEERFWSKVLKREEDECWIWLGSLTTTGYGQIYVNEFKKPIVAHRVAIFIHTGSWPLEGMHTDHLCRLRMCVNAKHLETVTPRENIHRGNAWSGVNARKTHCNHGHEFTPENTYYRDNGSRKCLTCHSDRERQRWRINHW